MTFREKRALHLNMPSSAMIRDILVDQFIGVKTLLNLKTILIKEWYFETATLVLQSTNAGVFASRKHKTLQHLAWLSQNIF